MSDIADEVISILSSATVDGNSVTLTCGDIDRSLYVKVDDVLKRLGGKWNGRSRKHIFRYNPTDNLSAVILSGVAPQKNPLAYFPTPDDVIEDMFLFVNHAVDWHLKEVGGMILEPSAGSGAMATKLRERYPKSTIHCIELDPINRSALESKGFEVVGEDFLDYSSDIAYDLVFMNPPFFGNGYIDHILHAFNLLDRSGFLVSVTPTSWTFSASKKSKTFVRLLASGGYAEIMGPNRFKESGTSVSTCITSIDKATRDETSKNRALYLCHHLVSNSFELYTEQMRLIKDFVVGKYQLDLFGFPIGAGKDKIVSFYTEAARWLVKNMIFVYTDGIETLLIKEFMEMVIEEKLQ